MSLVVIKAYVNLGNNRIDEEYSWAMITATLGIPGKRMELKRVLLWQDNSELTS